MYINVKIGEQEFIHDIFHVLVHLCIKQNPCLKDTIYSEAALAVSMK